MTTDEMIEDIIQQSMSAYKKNSKGCTEFNKLNRHESVFIEGIEFNFWREYAVYRVAQYIKDKIPNCNLSVELQGNDSYIQVELDDAEQKILNQKMYNFLKSIK